MAAIDVQLTASPTVEITHQNVFVGGVVTEQINGVTIGTAVSGSTNNQVIENTLGTPVGTSANPSVVPDATVQLNGVDMVDIPSGETDSILVLQSNDMTQVGSKQGVHWRIDDSAISINGSPVADVKSEDSLDIDVTQDGSPVGSWNGLAWVVPACVSPSLSIEVYSDAGYTIPASSFNFGATAYIKLIPTGIAPTSYTLFFGNGTKNAPQVTQAGNTLAWTVSLTGSVIISATATDGGDATADATPFTLTVSVVINKSISFDGVNDSGDAWFLPEAGGNFSFSFWFKMNNTGTSTPLFSIQPSDGGRPNFSIGFYQPTSSIVVFGWAFSWGNGIAGAITPDNDWHNMVVTYEHSTTTIKIYLDETEIVNNSSGVINNNVRMDVLKLARVNDWPFVGARNGNINLTDFCVYDDLLDTAQVAALQTLGYSTNTEVQRYPIIEASGTTSGYITDIVNYQQMILLNMTSPFGVVTDAP